MQYNIYGLAIEMKMVWQMKMDITRLEKELQVKRDELIKAEYRLFKIGNEIDEERVAKPR